MVRLFDKNKMTYAFKAHNDSVMSIALTANLNEFFTCGHDGLVKLWDLRKTEVVSSFNVFINDYSSRIRKNTMNRYTVSQQIVNSKQHQEVLIP